MTTTTVFQGMEAGAKSSSRVLRPPGGASNISFGADEENPPTRKNKMASSIFAEPDDPHAHRRNNPPGGKPTGVLCGEPSAPLRRSSNQSTHHSGEVSDADMNNEVGNDVYCEEPEPVAEQREDAPPSQPSAASQPAAGVPSGRRNPPGGKSSLVLG